MRPHAARFATQNVIDLSGSLRPSVGVEMEVFGSRSVATSGLVVVVVVMPFINRLRPKTKHLREALAPDCQTLAGV